MAALLTLFIWSVKRRWPQRWCPVKRTRLTMSPPWSGPRRGPGPNLAPRGASRGANGMKTMTQAIPFGRPARFDTPHLPRSWPATRLPETRKGIGIMFEIPWHTGVNPLGSAH